MLQNYSAKSTATYVDRFDLAKFYPEARRILKPDGTLAIWGYDTPNFPGRHSANELLHELYEVTLGPYWSSQRKHIDNHYLGILS